MFLYRRACNLTKIQMFESCLLFTPLINGFNRRIWVTASVYEWTLLYAARLPLNGVKYPAVREMSGLNVSSTAGCIPPFRIICDTVGRNLWICVIHGSRCAIYGSLLCAGIHESRRNLWIALPIYQFFATTLP